VRRPELGREDAVVRAGRAVVGRCDPSDAIVGRDLHLVVREKDGQDTAAPAPFQDWKTRAAAALRRQCTGWDSREGLLEEPDAAGVGDPLDGMANAIRRSEVPGVVGRAPEDESSTVDSAR
jgi:hypothetical protein